MKNVESEKVLQSHRAMSLLAIYTNNLQQFRKCWISIAAF